MLWKPLFTPSETVGIKKLENHAVQPVVQRSKALLLKILCISNYYMIKIHPEATSDHAMVYFLTGYSNNSLSESNRC